VLQPGRNSPSAPKLPSEKITLESIVYILCCIGSIGTVWLLRIVITRAILIAKEEMN
jgi:hypothetical protein